MIEKKPYRLKNQIQHYVWGTKNENAFIPKFLGIIPEKDKPYAELWIGAHPKAPSSLLLNDREEQLHSLIEKHPNEILGEKVVSKFGPKLPYLLKILSCERALSIQAHPDKELAKKLHAKDPQNYPDENHKPEIAIANDNLKALVGFKPINEIIDTIEKFSAFKNILSDELKGKLNHNEENSAQTIEHLYSLIMNLDEEQLKNLVEGIIAEIDSSGKNSIEEEEFIKQYNIYGVDVGLLSILLFNLLELSSGEAIFTSSGIPHAYLEGDIIECMANSDNVIRAGLTPKFKDVNTLLGMLNYEGKAATIMRGVNKFENVYNTSADEFEVSSYSFEEGMKSESSTDIVVIGLVTKGKIDIQYQNSSMNFVRGDSFLIPAVLNSFEIQSVGNSKVVLVRIPISN